jgi:hypothetical protein
LQTESGFRSVTRDLVVEQGGTYTVELNIDDLINILCTVQNVPSGQGTIVYAVPGEHAIPSAMNRADLQHLFEEVAGYGQATDGTAIVGVSEPGTYTLIGIVHRGGDDITLTSGFVTIGAGQREARADLVFRP